MCKMTIDNSYERTVESGCTFIFQSVIDRLLGAINGHWRRCHDHRDVLVVTRCMISRRFENSFLLFENAHLTFSPPSRTSRHGEAIVSSDDPFKQSFGEY